MRDRKHFFTMILLCMAPLVLLFLARAWGIDLGGAGIVLLLLLCPLSHLLMMRMGGGCHSGSAPAEEKAAEKETETIRQSEGGGCSDSRRTGRIGGTAQ